MCNFELTLRHRIIRLENKSRTLSKEVNSKDYLSWKELENFSDCLSNVVFHVFIIFNVAGKKPFCRFIFPSRVDFFRKLFMTTFCWCMNVCRLSFMDFHVLRRCYAQKGQTYIVKCWARVKSRIIDCLLVWRALDCTGINFNEVDRHFLFIFTSVIIIKHLLLVSHDIYTPFYILNLRLL